MPDHVSSATWRYAFHWGALDVFADGDTIPEALRPTAGVLARLDDRFRPAMLTIRQHANLPYAAVWRADQPLPEPTDGVEPGEEQLRGVVLAQVTTLTCFRCQEQFHSVYLDGGIPFFGRQGTGHRMVNGCPSCGSDFASSRIQGLAVLPLP